jgi:tetratricopeptide (TPR) repeat protein
MKPNQPADQRISLGEIGLVILLILVTLLAYWGCWRNGFAYDDEQYVTANPGVQLGLTPLGARWAFAATASSNWHPLTWLSLQLDFSLNGLNAGGYHVTNLFLHLVNVVLLYLALRLMTGSVGPSAVAVFFAVHPLHVESVAWIAERKDVFSALFWMLTIIAYAFYAKAPSLARFTLVFLSLALGLMAKPMLVTLPCVLCLLDYWPLARLPKQSEGRRKAGKSPQGFPVATAKLFFLEKLPLFGLAAISSGITLYVQRRTVRTLQQVPFADRLANAISAYGDYLVKTVWPVGLAPFYPLRHEGFATWTVAWALAALVGITGLVWWYRSEKPFLAVGWLWYVGTLVPVIGLVQVGEQALADRYTYIPLIGIFIMVAWGARDLAARWRISAHTMAALACVVALIWVWRTHEQVDYWFDDRTLWEHTLKVTQRNDTAHFNLGVTLVRSGDFASGSRHLREALAINPSIAQAHYNLGVVAGELHDTQKAIDEFAAEIDVNPSYAPAFYNLGIAYLRSGDAARAAENLSQASALAPDDAATWTNWAKALKLLGRPAEAADKLRKAVELAPKDPRNHCNLAGALWDLGMKEEARQEYSKATALNPLWPEHFQRTAWLLATHPDPRVRDGTLALDLATKANDGSERPTALLVETLAAALAETGQFESARTAARRALELAEAAKEPEQVARLREMIELFEKDQPFRETPPARPPSP